MQNAPSREKRDDILRWLGHGSELAWELKGERSGHRDVIWSLLVEAIDLIDRTPDQERRWLTSGTRSGGWNMIGLTAADLREIERLRVLSSMKPFEGEANYGPQRSDLRRALGVMEWLRWCNSTRQSVRLVKAAVALARGGETELVHKLYSPNRKKQSRQTTYEIKTRVVGQILRGLREDFGIIPGDGLTFKEA
jgi:hypothetical protein